jgi:hypothetical protein
MVPHRRGIESPGANERGPFFSVWSAFLKRGKVVAGITLDEFNKALGEFLTEIGRVEFNMLLVMDYFNDAGIEHLYDVYAPKTFGPKIDCMEAWCPASAFGSEFYIPR